MVNQPCYKECVYVGKPSDFSSSLYDITSQVIRVNWGFFDIVSMTF